LIRRPLLSGWGGTGGGNFGHPIHPLSTPQHMVYKACMDYYLLWSLLSGLLGGGLANLYLAHRQRMLEIDLAGFQERFVSDQKRRAVRERWDKDKDFEDLAKLAPTPVAPKRNPLLKFGIGKKAS